MENKVYVLGDIHGGYLGLKQVFERSGFDKKKDTLICLGDYVDGWSQTKEVIDELLEIKNLIPLLGNHDQWALEFYAEKMQIPSYITKEMIDKETVYFKMSDYCDMRSWYTQGGKETIKSLGSVVEEKYATFLRKLKPYYIHENKLFVHAGFNHAIENMEHQSMHSLIWDRFLIRKSFENSKDIDESSFTSSFYRGLKEIYVGHTPTIGFSPTFTTPQHWGKIWAMDTGACYFGKLSMMNIETKEVFQSDPLMELYADEQGRNGSSFNELNKKGEI